MTPKVIAASAPAPRKYELWRPIIQPQRRMVFRDNARAVYGLG